MKRLLIVIIMSATTGQVHAYNQGLICITFLSKNGSLETDENEKYKESDLELLLDYIENRFHVDRPKILHEKPSLYARGLGKDQSKYPRIRVIKEDLIYQNGVFYYERAQDTATGMMEQFAEVIGGTVVVECRKQEE